MDLEFKNSKHKKNIWFVFDKKFYYNGEILKIFSRNYPKNKRLIVYNYSTNNYYSHVINDKVSGFNISYYNKEKYSYISGLTGNIK